MSNEFGHLFAQPSVSRRRFLQTTGSGFGLLALSSLLAESAGATQVVNPLAARPAHFATRAKSVIWLFMNGGQSQVDTWDYKPELEKQDGKELKGFDKNTGFFTDQVGPLMKSPFKFSRQGKSGTWVSEIFPNIAKHVDDLSFIHSCFTETNNHSPALFQVNTGMSRMGFPCVGSWVTYGLGTLNQNLPAFVTMYDTLGRGIPKGHAQNWGAGFLPSIYQGTALKPQGAPIDNLYRSREMSEQQQRNQLDLLARLNRRQLGQRPGDTELAARIETFELAYRMQLAAPEALDLERETAATRQLYGIDNPRCTHFAKQCLIARRMVERGVRFVQLYHSTWDDHYDINTHLKINCDMTDLPAAGLIKDLKQRGLLDDTLVVWGGEFGRTVYCQGKLMETNYGRDHHPRCFTMWMAGGGVKPGTVLGETDDYCYNIVSDAVHIHDLQATILNRLGVDHKRLTFKFQGRHFRLTDVSGEVVKKLLA